MCPIEHAMGYTYSPRDITVHRGIACWYPNACFCGITTNRLRVVKLYLKGNTAFTNYWCILRCEANNGNYDDMPMLCREGDGER